MKKLMASLSAVFGIGANAGEKSEMVDVDSIRYSMPTISGESIEYVTLTKESFENAPQFHEDDWCQLEFYPKLRLAEIQEKLVEYKAFEAENRIASRWKQIYLRKIHRNSFNLNIDVLTKLEGSQVLPSPILTTASKPLGQVMNGFTVSIGKGAFLYGIKENDKIMSLAASVYSDQGNSELSSAFIGLYKTEGLILIDWRGQMIITESNEGELSVWKP